VTPAAPPANPPDTPARPRPRRRLWRIGLAAAALLVVGAFVGGGCAVTCRPSWYAPQAVDYARLPEDKRALVAIVDGIGGALQRPGPHAVDVAADQVNRWIVARHELSPEEWLDAELPDLPDAHVPVVSFVPGGRVRLAVLANAGGFGSVLSVIVRVQVAADELLLSIEGVRLGLLPVPRSWVMEAARRWGDEPARQRLGADGTWRVPNDFVWPNGKRRYRITAFTTTDHGATIVLTAQAGGSARP
jgi:hypothetical protein